MNFLRVALFRTGVLTRFPVFEGTGVADFLGRPLPRFGVVDLSSSESERPFNGIVVVMVRDLAPFLGVLEGDGVPNGPWF